MVCQGNPAHQNIHDRCPLCRLPGCRCRRESTNPQKSVFRAVPSWVSVVALLWMQVSCRYPFSCTARECGRQAFKRASVSWWLRERMSNVSIETTMMRFSRPNCVRCVQSLFTLFLLWWWLPCWWFRSDLHDGCKRCHRDSQRTHRWCQGSYLAFQDDGGDRGTGKKNVNRERGRKKIIVKRKLYHEKSFIKDLMQYQGQSYAWWW